MHKPVKNRVEKAFSQSAGTGSAIYGGACPAAPPSAKSGTCVTWEPCPYLSRFSRPSRPSRLSQTSVVAVAALMQQTYFSVVVSMMSPMVPFSIPISMLDAVRGIIGLSAYIVWESWVFSLSDN